MKEFYPDMTEYVLSEDELAKSKSLMRSNSILGTGHTVNHQNTQ